MLRKGLLLTAALGLVVASASNVRADLCFRYAKSGGGTLVARGAQLPANNTCQPLGLFESGGLLGAANGTICRDATDGRTIIFHYTYDGCSSNYFESATCRIQVDDSNHTASSSCRGTVAGSGGAASPFRVNDDAVIESCSGITLVGGGGATCGGPFRHVIEPVPEPAPGPARQ
jgi:hypothetical protein